jgi:hypothetical protein
MVYEQKEPAMIETCPELSAMLWFAWIAAAALGAWWCGRQNEKTFQRPHAPPPTLTPSVRPCGRFAPAAGN